MTNLKTAEQVAKELGIHSATVYALARKHNLKKEKIGKYFHFDPNDILTALKSAKASNSFNMRFREQYNEEFKTHDFLDFFSIEANDFIVASDSHVPYIHTETVELLLAIAEKYSIKTLIHAGDFWDQNWASQYLTDPEDLCSVDFEISAGKYLIQQFKKYFKEIYFICGTHDIRFWKRLIENAKPQPFDIAWRLTGEDGIKMSRYRYAEVNNYWRITHPANTVKIGTKSAIDLFAKYQKSLIIGHGHWWGIEQDPSGSNYFIYSGCLCDPVKIAYKNLWDTSHRNWKNGFVVVRNKYIPELFDIPKAKLTLEGKYGIRTNNSSFRNRRKDNR